MKTILALCLLAGALAFAPCADATYECDPITGSLCVNSYANGSCEYGTEANSVRYLEFGADGYTLVQAGTSCSGSPGAYAVAGVSASAVSCDASFNCDSVGAFWVGGDYGGSQGCTSEAYAHVDGQSQTHALPLCDVAGAPPTMPALLP